MRPSPRPLLLAALLVLAAGCSRAEADPGPRWTRLADGFRPRAAPQGPWVAPPGGGPALLLRGPGGGAAEDDGVWVEARIPAGAWRRQPGTPAWSAPRAVLAEGTPPAGGSAEGAAAPPRARLSAGGREHEHVALSDVRLDQLRPVAFALAGERVWATSDDPERPPGEAVLAEYVDRGSLEEGTWRVEVGRYFADGIPVLPGSREELVCDVPPDAVLRFATVGLCRSSEAGAPGRMRFRVLVDGREALAVEREVGPGARAEQHAVPIPEGAGRRLAFEVEGDAGMAAFLTPVVGPREVGGYGARPWGSRRPDVVLFLADTFRADNMALYGGDPAWTPHLDRFAAGARRFLRSWSSSTWTLPSHAALFAGLHPPQSGVRTGLSSLPPEAETIAERLRAAGYRTGAVTDHGFVTSTYGLAQGFERFDQEWGDLERTLAAAREFLDADDGRPAFLFVHTYRTHVPYVVSEATRRRLGERLGLAGDVDYATLQPLIERIPRELDPDAIPPEVADVVRGLVALYRGTAADLDQGFEQLRLELERRGLLPGGALVFTSDHGEGIFEHGSAGHGDWLWEGNTRVPLLIAGAGVAPGSVEHAASSVDLPRTIAALAGVEPAPEWEGTDLLALDADRPALVFQCLESGAPSRVALVDGARKLIAAEDLAALRAGTVEHAYDLAADPEERIDLSGSGATWPAEHLRTLAPRLAPAFAPRFEAAGVELAPEDLEGLRALGYMGG